MIDKSLLLVLFKAAYMQRWNDRLRPFELYELDKQAHKMIIAYVLGKCEEKYSPDLDWTAIIEGGLFEFIQRIVLTDLKPALFYKIKKDKDKYAKLNEFVYLSIDKDLGLIQNGEFLKRFREYLDNDLNGYEDINKRILKTAHLLATKWEFDIIEKYNTGRYRINSIKKSILKSQEELSGLKSFKDIASSNNLKTFIDLCGELRFQIRWNHLHRIPKTSVLGHMLIVAMITYCFSLEIKACNKRLFNNYFTALFHDLPEVLTRDIISPIKNSIYGFEDFIKEYEKEEMREIYSLIPANWRKDIRFFTEDEFDNNITINNEQKIVRGDIEMKYNKDIYNPRDGILVKTSDKLAAFIEAYLALANGINNNELAVAKESLKADYKDSSIYNIKTGDIFNQFG